MGAHDESISAALRRMEADMRSLASSEGDPYEAGRRIWAEAFSLAGESKDLMWPLWLLWGALTDWIEMKPDETHRACEAMRRASREWLVGGGQANSRRAYFEKWLYEELGIERPRG
jgi:hypothetical protein